MLKVKQEKRRWEKLASTDPYYSVASFDKFLSSNLDEAAKNDFFDTGSEYVENLWADFERLTGSEIRPERAVDYGCGVGRVLVPMSHRCGTVVGVDISEQMLKEASENCKLRGVANAEFANADRFAPGNESFDLVHSFIVIQHIEPKIGLDIARKLIAALRPGGVGMLHFTYWDPAPRMKRFKGLLYGSLGPLRSTVNRLRGRSDRPWMPMHRYDMNRIFELLQSAGCNNTSIRFTDHGLLGAMFLFEKGGELKY